MAPDTLTLDRLTTDAPTLDYSIGLETTDLNSRVLELTGRAFGPLLLIESQPPSGNHHACGEAEAARRQQRHRRSEAEAIRG